MQKAGSTADCDGVPAAGMASKVLFAAVLLEWLSRSSCPEVHHLPARLMCAHPCIALYACNKAAMHWNCRFLAAF